MKQMINKNKKYENTYCPICLSPTDKYGDCWTPCEFEAKNNGKSLYPRPLTELEMLIEKIKDTKQELKKLNKIMKEEKANLLKCQTRLISIKP